MSKSSVDQGLLESFLADPRALADPVRTDEDKDVWMSLLQLLRQLWETHAHNMYQDYLSGLNFLDISVSRIPSLFDINAMLARINWSAAYVDGMVDDRLYQEMQAARIFPVARHIRRKRDLFHSAAPDFIHDVIGHLPMLFSLQYQSLINEWALRALTARPSAQDVEASRVLVALIEEREKENQSSEAIAEKTAELERLHQQTETSLSRAASFARFYAWTFEFGITRSDDGEVRIGGSAALSSPSEFKRIISGKTRLRSFGEHAITTPVNYSVVQDTMFIAKDFQEYHKVLAGI
jgi:phenylalanine-4-hydroxylase